MKRALVRQVVAWKPDAGAQAGAPDARFLPPLVRRRCDDVTRAMLHVAHECASAAQIEACACVFASRHASLTALVELLDSITTGRALSPNTFSHSVHNAPAGVFSVWAKNRSACSSISAGRESFVCGLVEALGLLAREPERDVLLVCGDEFPLAPLTPHADVLAPTHAVALLLGESGDGAPLVLALDSVTERAESPAEPDELAFVRWWSGPEASLTLVHETRRWLLRRSG
ncbi:MAG: beta-ketoacyl synthase chain length factor [Deltaproteobacteria bacterium]|nr:beta-ketoacyl synthase chain length factor [Deltaproteobacteria bacterium]